MLRRLFIILIIILTLLIIRSQADAAPPNDPVVHVVKPGDTLSSIALRYGVSAANLMALNGLTSPNLIFIGQQIIIKPDTPAASPKVTKPTQVTASATGAGAIASAGPASAGQVDAPGDASAPSKPKRVAPPGVSDEIKSGRWVEVSLSKQELVAWEGENPVFTSRVSTGVPAHPTVLGTFRIYTKIRAQAMSGPGYYLPNVPYVMYFYDSYGLHGTYWHNNFGHPMSHGCVNLPTPAAAWLYDWASVGTPVVVHK